MAHSKPAPASKLTSSAMFAAISAEKRADFDMSVTRLTTALEPLAVPDKFRMALSSVDRLAEESSPL